jgi:anti-sigma B factor antagonist
VSLTWERRDREGIAIFDLKGRIVMGQEASEFRDAVTPLAAALENRIILNMAEVAYIDSTGLGALVYLAASAKKSKSVIRLLSMNARNLELLITTKLETIFQTFNDEQDAVNSFFPDRAVKKFDILEFVKEQQDKPGSN